MTRIAVSSEFVREGLVGGAEQALSNALDGLTHALAEDDQLYVVGASRDVSDPRIQSIAPPVRARPRFVQETISFARFRRRMDSYHFPNYFTPPVPGPCRVVTTIHDLQYRHMPENFSRRKRAWLRAAHEVTLRRADTVVALSEFVRDDLLSSYGGRWAETVTVVPNAVSWDRLVSEPINHEGRYVLSVASHYTHKNLATLVRSFALVRQTVPDVMLILAGQVGANLIGVRRAEPVTKLVAELGLTDVVMVTGYVSDERLGGLYSGASLFVFPSLFEGFGLPPVEALGVGLPVITTRCASLPEVTLGLAEYVDDPLSVEELAGRIVAQLDRPSPPSAEDVRHLREQYSVARVGRELYRVLTTT